MRTFNFGLNWRAFSKHRADSKHLRLAAASIQDLVARETLEGLSFLDVGCGTGLFSIAACQLKAARVVGFDINPICVDISRLNLKRLTPGAPITFLSGSALDPKFLKSQGQFHVVYAWGSLHHTGSMWEAIRQVSQRVCPQGLFILAIYNKHFTSPIWKKIKWFYNQLPVFGQRIFAIIFAGIIFIAKLLVTRRNPLNKERGMDFWYDVIDWMGGFPYEYASLEEVTRFVSELGFSLLRYIPAQVPTGCNEFVFQKKSL